MIHILYILNAIQQSLRSLPQASHCSNLVISPSQSHFPQREGQRQIIIQHHRAPMSLRKRNWCLLQPFNWLLKLQVRMLVNQRTLVVLKWTMFHQDTPCGLPLHRKTFHPPMNMREHLQGISINYVLIINIKLICTAQFGYQNIRKKHDQPQW